MATRDIRSDSIVLAGVAIPLSGSAGGERARLVLDESATRVNAMTKGIYATTVNIRGTLTIATYPEEDASIALWGIWRAQRASLGALNDGLSGQMNRGPSLAATWARGCITVTPPIVSEESSTVQTWTIEVDGVGVT